jgi:hypothetical protein
VPGLLWVTVFALVSLGAVMAGGWLMLRDPATPYFQPITDLLARTRD